MSLGGNSLIPQNYYPVDVLEEVFFNCLRQRREKLDPHSRSLKAALFPAPDNECRNLHLMFVLGGKYEIHMRPHRGRGTCIDEHSIHGNILAAGNHVIAGMDEIHSEIYWKALNKPSVAGCHPLSPHV